MRTKLIDEENFKKNLVISSNGCWRLSGIELNSDGRYHSYRFLYKKVRPQQIAWRLVNGSFPIGELWNKCGDHGCINPSHHLEIKNDYDRYISKISMNEITGCWEWSGYISPDGYGNMKMGNKIIRSHRFSYQHYVGVIPDGVDVLHRCDNRKCSNPSHLFLGNDMDNSLDREIKGRLLHKLTPDQVREIRVAYIPTVNTIELCEKYDISRKHLYSIVNKKSWRWIE